MLIKRYIECNFEPEVCNLDCTYCYLTQQKRKRQLSEPVKFSPQYVGKALSPNRLGGRCFISLSVAGETLHSEYIIDIACELLKKGHIVNITTNGTLKNGFEKLFSRKDVPYEHLLITFSFHYIELLRLNLMDSFWENVNRAKTKGASFYIKLNLCDDYIPYLDNIQKICEEKIGFLPQLELTRKENKGHHTIMTKFSRSEYQSFGKNFDSKLFEFTCSNFRNNRKKNFCYAGDWSAVVNLRNGEMRGCYCDERKQNIFDDLGRKIQFAPIGNNCASYCHNGQHFLSWGVIPELKVPSYAELRHREGIHEFTDEMILYTDCKLEDSNRKLPKIEKQIYNLIYTWYKWKNF